jgi:glutathione synthase/RimK-type ligase-like ATP-grasp enzyme
MNHPASTYIAEQKVIQLTRAQELGFKVPDTLITNDPSQLEVWARGREWVAVKGLDTVLVREQGLEVFGFTSFMRSDELLGSQIQSAPMIVQEALQDKLDLRVTVVDQKVFCAAITLEGAGVIGDWRKSKESLSFSRYDLPDTVASRCALLVSSLGLCFGAIDIAYSGGEYYFLEVNPTGEWAWLRTVEEHLIDRAIADYLCAPQ